ncbi:hypothetical protein [Paenibacillus sp. VMFN-D1]|uniref:hypothetical protein n=1 Tax=Paenibacillus sp. VMFN-D1 TaxID=2135608 RepID=UPI000E21CDB4|nr:hypothetical protein [Paenibacillus sp. VMFN-D1]RED32197.1 hypothetical protein C7820_5471 [Paenibacillus sp. VMFN-D1]
MADELIDYFSNKLSAKSLVFKYMKGWDLFFWIALCFFIVGLILSIIYKNILFISAGILISIFATYKLNQKAKQIINDKYKIVIHTMLWSSDNQYYNYIQNQIKNYLCESQLNSERQLDKLIEQLSKRAESLKPTIFFLPGLFIVLFLPVWTQFEIVLFKGVNVNTAIFLLVIHFILLIFLVYLLAGIKHITDDLMTLKRQRVLNLINHIEDISLSKLEKNKKENKLRLVRRRAN